MPRTKLSWEEYKPKALKLRKQGLNFPQIYEKLGSPFWEGKDYKIESDGKGGVKRKNRETRRQNRIDANQKRAKYLKVSNEGRTKSQRAAANRKALKIKKAGLQVDHKHETARTGRALEDKPARLDRRRYIRRLQPGDRSSNYQGLPEKQNSQKNRDYNKLDKYFAKKEAVSPSPSLKPTAASRVLRIGNSGRIKGALRNAITISNIMQASGAKTVSTLPGAPHIFIP